MHHHGPFQRLLHYLEHLTEIGAELVWELFMPPRRAEHTLLWLSFLLILALGGAMLVALFLTGQATRLQPLVSQAFSFVYLLYPLWLPILLGKLFIEIWLRYIRFDFLRNNPGVLLEVRIPREIEKTPKSMELLFMALWETGSVEYNETYWVGKVRPWWSFEFASFGGDIHFYVWTLPKYRNVLESQIYAQYPTVELIEVPDYAKKKRFNPPYNFMWGTYYVFQKPDVYPIMTYVDYGLDKETEEEYKVDPLSTSLEYLGSIRKGEEMWVQILAQAYRPFKLVEGQLFKDTDWVKEAQEEINKIMKRDPETKSTRQFTEVGYPIVPTLTEWEKKQVEAIERSINKRAFRCAVRACYHTEKENFHQIGSSVSGMQGLIRKPFNSNLLNGFKLGWYTDISDPMKDFLFLFGLRMWGIKTFLPRYAKTMLDAYRRRSFFYAPYRNWKSRPFILTTEELATMYHFPGKIVTTPTFERIPSKKVEPPANLPV